MLTWNSLTPNPTPNAAVVRYSMRRCSLSTQLQITVKQNRSNLMKLWTKCFCKTPEKTVWPLPPARRPRRRRLVRGVYPPLLSGLSPPISNPHFQTCLLLQLYQFITVTNMCIQSSLMILTILYITSTKSSFSSGSRHQTPAKHQGWKRMVYQHSGSKH